MWIRNVKLITVKFKFVNFRSLLMNLYYKLPMELNVIIKKLSASFWQSDSRTVLAELIYLIFQACQFSCGMYCAS